MWNERKFKRKQDEESSKSYRKMLHDWIKLELTEQGFQISKEDGIQRNGYGLIFYPAGCCFEWVSNDVSIAFTLRKWAVTIFVWYYVFTGIRLIYCHTDIDWW